MERRLDDDPDDGDGPVGQQISGAFDFDMSVLQEHALYLEDCLWPVRAF